MSAIALLSVGYGAIRIWPKASPPSQESTKASMAEVQVGVAFGGGERRNVERPRPDVGLVNRTGDIGFAFECAAPFTCYPEIQLKSQSVPLVFGGHNKNWARLIFMVANVSDVPLKPADVGIETKARDVFLYRIDEDPNKVEPKQSIRFLAKDGYELIPYRVSSYTYDFAVDVIVNDALTDVATAGFLGNPLKEQGNRRPFRPLPVFGVI